MKKNYQKIFRPIILVLLCLGLGILIFLEAHKDYVEYKEKIAFQQLANTANEVHISTKSQEKVENDVPKKSTVQILPEYEKLYAQNTDLYGWIQIVDTVINYPVMYSPSDPEMYLHKDFNKDDSISGTPFVLDPHCSNIIVFAHNMKNGTMFGALPDYKNYDFWNNHRFIQFNTLYQKATYEIIAISKAVAYYDKSDIPENAYLFYEHTNLDTQEEFDAYIQNAKNNAYFETGISATFGDSIITLCTCDYFTKDARLIVVAKKLQ